MDLKIDTPKVFEPFLKPSRYKVAHGGRGSGKSHFFAELLVEQHVLYPGLRSVCVREIQKTLSQSAKRIIEDKIRKHSLEDYGFRVLNDKIITPGDGVIIFMGLQDFNAESIKSLEGFGLAWIEEAQTLSNRSLELLRPTIRDSGIPAFSAEIWASFNPTRKQDAIDELFRGLNGPPEDTIIVEANWNNNPYFPDVLELERLDDYRNRPDAYDHIWGGSYVTAVSGAYFARNLVQAKSEGRVGFVPVDPLMSLYAFVDIGGTGAKADSFVIWIVQFIGQAIHIVNYYEAQGQELKDHLYWLKSNECTTGNTTIYLPHDGTKHESISRITYESELKRVGYSVVVRSNDGKGAAMQRVEAVRSVFHRCHFDKVKCEGGLEGLGWYHEKKNRTGLGVGPKHDWSSHASDSFGFMALEAGELTKFKAKCNPNDFKPTRGRGSWMS